MAISGATVQTYVLVAADVGRTIRVQETASNAGGASSPASSNATAAVLPLAPTNTAPPTISGSAQQGKTLTEAHGAWTGNPTSYAYQWLRCDSTGANCVAISGATVQTYVLVAADVGRTIRVQETASNEGGAGSAATSSATAWSPRKLRATPPRRRSARPPRCKVRRSPRATARGRHPTGFAYQWQQCDGSGNGCLPISGATAQTYVPVAGDVGHTIRVQETASNAGGSGAPATSSATTAVTAPSSQTFGKTSVGAVKDYFGFERKRVNRYALPSAATVSKLSVYLETHATGQQVLEGLVYADNAGSPAALLGVTQQLTFVSTSSPGWFTSCSQRR